MKAIKKKIQKMNQKIDDLQDQVAQIINPCLDVVCIYKKY